MNATRFFAGLLLATSIAFTGCKSDGADVADSGAHGAMSTGGTGGKITSTGGSGGMSALGSGGSTQAALDASVAGGGKGGSGGRPGTGGSGGKDAGGTGGQLDAAMMQDASAPAASCAGSQYLLCEDFEGTAVGGIPTGWTKHGDPVSVQADAAHSGEHALKLGPITDWERRIYHDAAELGGAHWGRIYYKVMLPVPDAFVHSTLVAFSGDGPTRGASEFRVVDTVKQAKNAQGIGNKHQFLYNVQPQSSDEFGTGTQYDWQFDGEWHCAEWHIDAANQSYQFFYDGDEAIGIDNGAGHYQDTDIPPMFDEIKVGWNNYQKAPPGFTAWIDDVALDDERIGCE